MIVIGIDPHMKTHTAAALDAATGRQLWSVATQAGVNAPPITYEIDGVQYVAVAATGLQTLNTPRGDAMLVFSLPTTPKQ